MLRIHLSRITEKGLDLKETVVASGFPSLNRLAREDGIRFVQPIQVRILAKRAGETVQIDGSVRSVVRTRCSRCLEPFDLTVQSDFTTTAVPELPPSTAVEAANEIELAADQMEVITYSSDSIDLHAEIAQQLIMALPFNPQCTATCKGLCSQCGTNLNQSSCRCPTEDKSNPFTVLKGLSLPCNKD